jgi:excisionase family DNA binding protein
VTDRLLTADEAAAELHCSPSTVWRMRRRGELATYRAPGRTLFLAESVQAWVARRTEWPAEPVEGPAAIPRAPSRAQWHGYKSLLDVPEGGG